MPTTHFGEMHVFGCAGTRCDTADAIVVGNKGANLIRMAQAGLPVPPGFVLPTDLCGAYLENGRQMPAGVPDLLRNGIQKLEQQMGLGFGSERRPLLLSVRSGAAASMPGMLDTILNVGLCERTVPALIRMTGNPRHAWDSYRRLIQAFAEVARGLPAGPFERILSDHLQREEVPIVTELDVAALKLLVRDFLDHYESNTGESFPQDPFTQLASAVEAVFRSWRNPRAVEYRRLQGLADLTGTAVTVQTMVFGNMGGTSGSGVGFTRNPATGEDELYIDYLPNAQGEDAVSGRSPTQGVVDLQQSLPELYDQLRQIKRRLESLFHDAQDFEFTVQERRLYLLQSRNAKRTSWAALRIACELVAEHQIDQATALERLRNYDLALIQHVRVVAAKGARLLGKGVPASPGVAVGAAVFDPEQAVQLGRDGGAAILDRNDISTSDVSGLHAAAGILTSHASRSAHAAVVARQFNKPCIVGCRSLMVSDDRTRCRIGEEVIQAGDTLSLDGNSGCVYAGALEIVAEHPTQYLEEVERWRARLQTAGSREPTA